MGVRVPLPDPKVPIPWAQQMGLEKIDENTFRSTAGAPFGAHTTKNGESRPRAFGGHVYAQAVYAASKTVPKGMLIHSVTGYFLVLGLADESFTYHVQTVRSGRNYCVRRVDVWQDEDRTLCFSSMCSFKNADAVPLEIQTPVNIEEKYSDILEGKTVHDIPLAELEDMRAAYDSGKTAMTSTFPGMYTSILPFDTFHKGIAPRSRQHMYIYSAIGEEPSPPDANLEACAHLYHSDRESVWSIMRQYELLEVLDIASSLSHTVIFHTGPDKIKFHDTRGRRWFYLETGSERVGDGRGLHKGRIYDRDGNHIASTIQDGAIRLKWKNEEQRRLKEERMNSDAKL